MFDASRFAASQLFAGYECFDRCSVERQHARWIIDKDHSHIFFVDTPSTHTRTHSRRDVVEAMTAVLFEPMLRADIMRQQSGQGDDFHPPSPKDFTEGTVYACTEAGRPEFALFGDQDTGRFKDVATSKAAVAEMTLPVCFSPGSLSTATSLSRTR